MGMVMVMRMRMVMVAVIVMVTVMATVMMLVMVMRVITEYEDVVCVDGVMFGLNCLQRGSGIHHESSLGWFTATVTITAIGDQQHIDTQFSVQH